MNDVIWVCKRCGIFEPDSYSSETDSMHAICERDSEGDPYPAPCGPITVYVPKSTLTALQAKLEKVVETLSSLVGHYEAKLQFPHKDPIDFMMSIDRAKATLKELEAE